MNNKYLYQAFSVCFYLFYATACINAQELFFSRNKIIVKNPGDDLSISKLGVKTLDSVLGYPAEYAHLVTYVLVKRNNKSLPKNLETTVLLNKKDLRYKWKVIPDPFFANYFYVDTIKIEPNVWYEIGCEKCDYNLYYYWDLAKDKEIIKRKSYPQGPF